MIVMGPFQFQIFYDSIIPKHQQTVGGHCADVVCASLPWKASQDAQHQQGRYVHQGHYCCVFFLSVPGFPGICRGLVCVTHSLSTSKLLIL